MSTSPPKEPDVEQTAQSGDEQDHMDREQEGQAGTGLGEFEVKEQDRWLPIANGWCCFFSHPFTASFTTPNVRQKNLYGCREFNLFDPCVTAMHLCAHPGTLLKPLCTNPNVRRCTLSLASFVSFVRASPLLEP
jgi:hypothetical protein